MPLGIISLAANLRTKNIPVRIYKPRIRLINKPDYKIVASDILKHKPSIIGFSTWCISYAASLLVAKELKTLAPETPIIFGGPQASIISKQTLIKFPYIDFILIGEADISFPHFISEWTKKKPDFSKISGLTYRIGTNVLQNRSNDTITNLDELPIPAYDLIPKQKSLKLDVGRGCPFHCTYCSTNNFFSKKYRIKSADRIIIEMMTAYTERKINSFSFAHDMFTLNKEFILELCTKLLILIEKNGFAFTWTCSARIDCVSDEMLINMKKAGCRSIFFGIESGSEKIQKKIQKNLDVIKAYKIADLCRTIGMDMHASFIIGFPDETKSDVEKTLQVISILALKGVFVQISDLSLLPGTPLYNTYKNKLLFDGRFSNFSQAICTQEDLKLIVKYPDIFSSFYYLPVKTLTRIEIIFICRLINRISQFRNTLYMLSEYIDDDLKKIKILQLYKLEFKRLSSQNRNQYAIVSHWIQIFNEYLLQNKINSQIPFIYDIFSYESFIALLKALYTSWQIVNPQINKLKLSNNFRIKPTPTWKILSTTYKLESILPSKNRWGENKKNYRKGVYKYLLVAVSEIKCKNIRINSKEVFLLENLSELFFCDYVQKVKPILTEEECLLWIKKMRRLGVVEIIEQ